MAKTILQAYNAITTTANTTQYWPLTGRGTAGTTETATQLLFRSPGTLSGLYVRIATNSIAGNTIMRTRDNAANGGQSVTIGSNATGGFEDTSGTDTVAAGDKLNCQSVPGASTGTMNVRFVSTLYNATTNTVTRIANGNTLSHATASVTRFTGMSGTMAAQTAEADVQTRQRKAGTFKNACVNVTANARTTTTTFTLRKNTADTTIVVSMTTGTGWFEDTTHSDTVAAGDDVNWETTTLTGTQTLTCSYYAADFETTDGTGQCITQSSAGFATSTTTGNIALTGIHDAGSTTEAFLQMKTREAFTFSQLTMSVRVNTPGLGVTYRFRKNGANGNQVVTIASGTGIFTDTTNTDVCDADDLVNIAYSHGAGAGFTIEYVSVWSQISGQAITKALSTETTSISESITELAAKIRTRSETVALTENRTRLATKLRPISTQTTTLSENIIRVKGKVKTLTTETITVTGGSIARLLAKIRTGSDTTVIAENRARLAAKNRALATQTAVLSENLARLKTGLRVLPESWTIGGTAARLKQAQRILPQTTSKAESLGRIKSATRALALQTIILSDSRARIKSAVKTISQTVLLTENITRLAAKIRAIAPAQTTVLADSVARQIIGGAQQITRTLSQTVVLSETVGRRLAAQRLLTQTVPKAESLVRVRGVLKSLSQTILLSESRSRIKSTFRTLSQTVSSSDSITKRMTKIRAIAQTILLAENVVRETVGNLVRSIVQTVTVSDNIVRRTAKLVILVQTVAITEQARRLSTKLRIIPPQTISLTDSAIAEINVVIKNVIRIIGDIIGLTEHLQAYVIKVRDRFRYIREPSQKRVLSNHPAWLLGSRGMHDNFEEFDG